MAMDKTFLIKSIQKKESMIVAYCAYTNMPLVVCDPETFNDQVWIFDDEAQLQEFAIHGKKGSVKRNEIPKPKFPWILFHALHNRCQ